MWSCGHEDYYGLAYAKLDGAIAYGGNENGQGDIKGADYRYLGYFFNWIDWV